MALVLNDRVKETTTPTGTGTINLAGAEIGFETFVAGVGNSNTCYYCIAHQSANEFEVGLGTVTDATPDTLARTTVISSSNSDSAVDFSAGTKDVFCTLPASKTVFGDASGNVGIGTSSPAEKLDVSGDIKATKIGAGISPIVPCEVLSTGATSTALRVLKSGSDDSTQNNLFSVTEISGHGRLSIHDTSQNEDIRLDSNGDSYFLGGKVGIGSSDPATDGYSYGNDLVIKAGASSNAAGAGLSIQNVGRRYGCIAFGDSAATNAGEIYYDHTNNAMYIKTSQSERFSLDSSGNAVFTGNVTAYGSISDERLKENIEVIENPIEKIKDLKGVTFNYKKDGSKSTGLIAQDLEKVLPEAVYTSETLVDIKEGEKPEEHLAIHYGNTVGLLVEAIKEQQEQIETLTAKVKELEDR